MNAMRSGALAGALALAAAPLAWGCGAQLRGTTDRVENARYEIVFAPIPAPIEAGKHFSLEVVVCPRAGALPPVALRVNALMPEHRHGMNYRPTIVARGAGSFRADGLMFHMPGRWEIQFDVVTASGTERLAATTELE